MAISFVAATAADGGASVAVAVPPGTAAGDVMVAHVCPSLADPLYLVLPDGWFEVPNTRLLATGNPDTIACYRVATSSEPASYTFELVGLAGTVYILASIHTYRGADTATPIGSGESGSASGLTTPSIPVGVDGSWLLYHGGADGTTSAEITGPGTRRAVEVRSYFSGATRYAHLSSFDAGGPVAPGTYARTLTSPHSSNICTILALRPALQVSVDAGPDDAEHNADTAFTRTAVEDDGGDPITSREWNIQSGPAGVGTIIGTTASLDWTPTTLGTYVLRYTAANSATSDFDDVTVTVIPVWLRGIRIGTSTTTTVTVARPDGVVAGDALIGVCLNDFISATASGWERSSAAGSSGSDSAFNIFRRTAVTDEPSSYAFEVGASTSSTVAVIALSQQFWTTTWDVAPAVGTLTVSSSTTTPATPSVTAIGGGVLLLAAYGTQEGSSGWAGHTPPTGMIELLDHVPTSGPARALHVAAQVVATGATGTRTAQAAGSATIYLAQAMILAARPTVPFTRRRGPNHRR